MIGAFFVKQEQSQVVIEMVANLLVNKTTEFTIIP